MILRLTIANQQESSPGLEMIKTFDGRGATIGRGPDNDWVLPDPNRHLSKRHCEIAFQDGQYVVIDTSTNGLYLNQSSEPLGRGHQWPLQDGDSLTLGDYRIEVRIDERPHSRDAAAALGGDPFTETLPGLGSGPVAAPFDDLDPFGIDRDAGFGQPASNEPARSSPPADPSDVAEDPLFAPWPGGAAESPSPLIPDDDALFGDGGGRQDAPFSEPDHVPSEQAYFRPPDVAASQIPEDWDLDGDSAEPMPPVGAPPTPPARDAAVVPPHPKQPAQPTAQLPGVADADALRSFLAGAGLEHLDLSGENAAELMHTAGAAFREMVLGLREVLMARSTIKNEFRLEATMIRSANNNPLKFSISVEEALAAMVRRARPGYLPPVGAVQEGFKDIQAHQLAMMAGMQVALTALLRSFDPEGLKRRLEKGSVLDSILPSARKAKYWELYETFYQQIASEAEQDFHGLFGRAFARAYEEQVKKL